MKKIKFQIYHKPNEVEYTSSTQVAGTTSAMFVRIERIYWKRNTRTRRY